MRPQVMERRGRQSAVAAMLMTAVLFAAGCGKREEARASASAGPVAPPMKPAPATPILAKKVELGEETHWNVEWDKIVELAIPQEMVSRQVPRDVKRFCPRFYEMGEADKRAFWAYFFQALAGAEAGLKPTTRVRHTEPEVAVTDTVSGRAVRSEGLLQLTYEDQRRYGCTFDWQHDKELAANDPAKTILLPKNNLECGVRILDNQIIAQRRPLLSEKSYWSTLRPGTVSYRVFAKQMTNVPLACRVSGRPQAAKR
ncbi:MAG: hypothetical protein PW789_18205 [Edaphobacter sp.]|uniref:hypothetical protein n=1 Tax=Edaphobacter sp. TaxID=1934404 RepID=UPI00239668B3|nr:hypothetical protein [Edaphobacter sp.]MDE1178510.1 hypothetical protein [Edaphobacter sp.]